MATRGGPVPPGPPPANPNSIGEDDDPDAEYAREMRDIQRQDRLDRLADMRDEAEDRRRIRRLRRKQELAKLEAQADGLVPDRGRGYDDDGEGEQIAAIRRELSAERSDLKAQIDRLQGVITKSNEDTLKAQIDRLSQKIDDIQKTPGTDPVQAISSAFELAGKIRNQVDSLLPIPAPPPIDPGLSHQQVLDRERAQLEHDIYRLERQEALETVQYKREQLRADREKATERWQGIVNGLGQVGGALSQALAPTLAGMLPAGIGGGPSAPGAPGAPPGMGMATAPPPATGPPPTPQGIPYVCPSSTCRKTNYVPPGTGIARCDHCGFGPVYLQPHGTPPPAGMVNSV
jgi:hypothetical protein